MPFEDDRDRARHLLAEMFRAAVRAADPKAAIARHLPPRPKGRTIVVAIGKAAIPMARALEQLWPHVCEGIVIDRHGAIGQPERLPLLRASHPIPDAAGEAATAAVLAAVSGLSEDDLVIALISGGGSALLPAPPAGMTLADEQAVNRALLASGLPISRMNLVRTHLSTIKGGGLTAAARPARVISFVVSDVPGDDPALVSSGPTIAPARGISDALATIREAGLALPEAAMRHLRGIEADDITPPPRETSDEVHIVASAMTSLVAAADLARAAGYAPLILSDAIEGEASEIGREQGLKALREAGAGERERTPLALLSGGETTVTIGNTPGRGGRNSEFLLAFARQIAGCEYIHALAADTDGIDGSETNAGAFADGTTIARLRSAGVDAGDALARHDAFTAFEAIGDLFVTGPTGTNVNDFRAILIDNRPTGPKGE
ncbi:glycerate kinase [Sphingomonas sp.]|uniref:glycerate kinase type-2 family protein n=1 Tax=Sphingomonas sp. TaxID=28214 RepID=UPI000DB56251|nr:glycerate kinase [Sphingomonas sp.]PZU09645.1 MAG: glycerate kinase [Sphingomonas sp.]